MKPKTRQQHRVPPSPHCVYWLYGDNDEILYIGVTKNPRARLASHKCTKDWWPLVRRHELVWYDDETKAKDSETVALRRHRPRCNPVIPEPDGRHITRRGGKPQPGIVLSVCREYQPMTVGQ